MTQCSASGAARSFSASGAAGALEAAPVLLGVFNAACASYSKGRSHYGRAIPTHGNIAHTFGAETGVEHLPMSAFFPLLVPLRSGGGASGGACTPGAEEAAEHKCCSAD